ncbi:SDR family oxidoreductase [Staphylococcus pseudoxylosus]|uniref:Diacetyl reductase [(S)-acetoin forming] n=1 Tax=Staphylococcus pseudoxylosus TaxID=2282419 RepID=A0AAQ0MHA4_9STAP|nr:SDR family oxidoreductase [Staphylococcus pseudoxylosus]PTI84039.1 2-deoxy-D-gluconate 3-dehydrogenase [Staphylococcus xylosus]MBM2657423.1 SDR family oxidoreductase [Staphylococcus pseudoxylosus]MCE5001119.1 SDR family oxidoreductase [Staphylococcus pseudoxylosus]MDW8545086.1 SDR family oxidoreductase [Staphylococcus pseudoxylosus]MEB5782264.1 SDR family oxidoreductase [Staphylococcus pseudoxylosus]
MTKFNTDSFSVKGKNAIVTGGARGLGKYYTIALTMYGANVTVVSSSNQAWEALKESVEQNEGEVSFIQQDLKEQGAAEKVVAQAVETWGSLDILVNNAGVQIRNNVLDYKDEDWQNVIDINLNATYYMAHEAAKVMTEQQTGKMINIGSMQSYRAGKNIFPYAASKHGVVGITRAYADALAPYNIQVNALSPGYIRTDMTKVLEEDPIRGPEIKGHIPSGEWGVPEDLMGPLIFLASSASDYVTGTTLPVDGGYLLR